MNSTWLIPVTFVADQPPNALCCILRWKWHKINNATTCLCHNWNSELTLCSISKRYKGISRITTDNLVIFGCPAIMGHPWPYCHYGISMAILPLRDIHGHTAITGCPWPYCHYGISMAKSWVMGHKDTPWSPPMRLRSLRSYRRETNLTYA